MLADNQGFTEMLSENTNFTKNLPIFEKKGTSNFFFVMPYFTKSTKLAISSLKSQHRLFSCNLFEIFLVYTGNYTKKYLFLKKVPELRSQIFFLFPPLKSTESTSSGLESQSMLSYILYQKVYQRANFFHTSKSTQSSEYFEPYGRRRLGPFLACCLKIFKYL